MQNEVVIDGKSLTIEDVASVARNTSRVKADESVFQMLDHVRGFIDKIADGNQPYYGINTGFGALAETKIAFGDIEKLQHNLLLSHAVGVGDPLSYEEARALMLLRANTLAQGHSGCRRELVQHFIDLLNAGCAPYVPAKGSVGASGDLAPLAHVALLLVGEGDALIDRKTTTAQKALQKAGLKPLRLKAKEGLALINGTQAMTALGCLSLLMAEHLCDLADMIGACSLEAVKGSTKPFDPRIHQVRPHPGQQISATNIAAMLKESEISASHVHRLKVQDAYSFRCMPQVHGATRDVLSFVRSIIEREINSATDNPLVFLNTEKTAIDILSGGNFHGQPLAFALDFLAIAVSELANISERRVEQMLNPALSSGLPPFLIADAGLNSGMMILQVTAAALINENKVLCHPASTDSIPTSANREDHVSMGMTSANKAKIVIENCYRVLGIELMIAAQGVDFRLPLRPAKGVLALTKKLRETVAFADVDRAFGLDVEKAYQLCKSGILKNILATLSEK